MIGCKVRDCVATGYNVGNNDTLINCSADAKYAEAFCVPYTNAKNAYVEMNILDSRNGLVNEMLAKINGTGHQVIITTGNPKIIPDFMAIKLGSWHGYGNYNKKAIPHATIIKLANQTKSKILTYPGTKNADITSKGEVIKEKSQSKRLI